ncbi:MAG TPA: S1C family serine protease [Roseiarcus sp.]|nr:S1C family serine protease [Roseiarcus sp.]
MAEPNNPLIDFSNSAVELVERAASSLVAVRGGGRWPTSGIHWRPGVIVTAEEVLDRDENISLVLPGGREIPASLAGRDPTTDVAVLRFQADGLPVATVLAAASRPGQTVMAVGNYDGAPVAAFGMIAYAGGPWRSLRGGAIDSFIRLDLTLSPTAEGGAVVDTLGRVIGMAVLGPRRRPLAIPASTIERSVDQLLARGRIYRGYLGAGLRSVRRHAAPEASASSSSRGALVVSLDPDGPSARAGLLLGDIIVAWNGKPIERVRDIIASLGPDSVGATVELSLVRGGTPATLKVVIGERPVS